MKDKFTEKDTALVVGAGTSKIGQSVAACLTKNFDVIQTSKDSLAMEKLDILDVQSIHEFIERYIKKYGKRPLKAIFLNSGIMNVGETIDRSNFYRRSNNGDPDINIHLHNVVLMERLQMAGIVTTGTKVIYNASAQIFDAKQGYEDYVYMKGLASSLLLNDDRWNPTILCTSLVKGTTMENNFKNKLNAGGKGGFKNFVEKTMPEGQPSLSDISNAVAQILSHTEETREKFVLIDGGAIKKNKGESVNDDLLFYDDKSNSLVSYNNVA